MRTDQSRTTPTSLFLPVLCAILLLGAPLAGADIRPLDPVTPVIPRPDGPLTCPQLSAGDGGYVVGWQIGLGDDDAGLQLRRFDERGRPLAPAADFGPTAVSGDACADLAVVAQPDGAALAFWRKTARTGPFATIEHQIFATPVTAPGVANASLPATGDGGGLPNGVAAAGLSDGTTLGSWRDPSGSNRLTSHLFAPSGQALAAADELSAWEEPQVAALAGDLFLVAGISQGDPGAAGSLAGRLVTLSGPVGEAFTLADQPARVAARSQAGFAAAWADRNDLAFRLFANDGTPVGPVRKVSPEDGSTPFLSPGFDVDEVTIASVPIANGGPDVLVLAWRETAGDSRQLFARTVAIDGSQRGPKVAIGPAGDEVSAARIASASPGSFLATWSDGSDVLVRAFAATPGSTPIGLDGRFRISVTWEDFQGNRGLGTPVPFSEDTVAFWFFRPGNLELMVKVLDGRTVNGNFWVFGGALTTVEYTLTVTDTVTGAERTYENPSGELRSFADTAAFPGDP